MSHINTRWNESLALGIPEIDEQHRNFLDLIGAVCQGLKSYQAIPCIEEVVAELDAYTRCHFADEEALMEQHGFPGLPSHRASHAHFTTQVRDLGEQLAKGERVSLAVLHLLSDWLTFHISLADRQFVNFIHEQSANAAPAHEAGASNEDFRLPPALLADQPGL